MTILGFVVAAAVTVTVLIVIPCIRISADRPGKKSGRLPTFHFLLAMLIVLWILEVLAIIVSLILPDRLDIIRQTKDLGLPEAVKGWIWGWK